MATTTKKSSGAVMDFLGGLGDEAASDAPPSMFAVTAIRPDPEQPRTEFDQERHDNLVASINEMGVLQPLLLRETGENPPYEIIAGERRWRAAKAAGLAEVPGFIRNDLTREQVELAQVVENTQRADLTDVELARRIQRLLDNTKIKKKDLAAKLDRKPSYISRLLAMLDAEWKPLVDEGVITSAGVLERFKALGDDDRAALLDAARAKGAPLGREDIDALVDAKKAAAAPTVVPDPAHQVGETVTTGDTGTATASEPDAGSSSEGGGDGLGGLDSLGGFDGEPGAGGSADDAGDGGLGGSGAIDGGDSGSEPSTATASGGEKGGGTASKNVSFKMTVEDFERLIPHFVDKSADKVEFRVSPDLAVALIENLGGAVPDEVGEYGAKIKDLMA